MSRNEDELNHLGRDRGESGKIRERGSGAGISAHKREVQKQEPAREIGGAAAEACTWKVSLVQPRLPLPSPLVCFSGLTSTQFG